ncbi:uncharacterized protein LOC107636128 [Arachis ipaensis]|uniref:uncharacterized protein LOC107636128 n=1 Tax=Arachis ipaensis TaxID=130454 RepID=UPI0007AEF829|nr:uncharacterized protein LOC107636128 [Arachis ipaensis]XP_025647322.1 uncharacterized protein LOC112742298 [Arachis hypogaea]
MARDDKAEGSDYRVKNTLIEGNYCDKEGAVKNLENSGDLEKDVVSYQNHIKSTGSRDEDLIEKRNKEKFGDIDLRINKLEDEIRKLDDMASEGVYDGIIEARMRALVSFYKKWYVKKEIHWKQMSMSRHAKHMDKNIRYFHNLASVRRMNNQIDALVINGRLVRNQAKIKIVIIDFYKNLYHQEASPLIGFQDGLVNKIQEEEVTELERMLLVEEIKDLVWECESSKASDYDDYNMNFCWGDIDSEFTRAVMYFFLSAKLPIDSNVTWVTAGSKVCESEEY